MQKISLRNTDGSWNGKLIAALISLIIVLSQQILAMFGLKFTGDWSSIVAVINTILTILGLLGVITDVQTVSAPTTAEDRQVEATANQVAENMDKKTTQK